MDLDERRSAASVLLLVRLGAERGAHDLLPPGLTLDGLRAPGAEVSAGQELEVVRALQAAVPDPALPLEAGRRYHVTTYGIWGFALASSPTVRSALDLGARFVDLSFTFCGLAMETDARELRLALDDAAVPADVRSFVAARDLAGLRTLMVELTGGMPLARLSVRQPRTPGPWEEVFGLAPEFDAAANVAVLDAGLLDLPLPQADELTRAATEAQCRELVSRRRARSGLAGSVRDAVLRTPGTVPSAAQVAGELHLSERTLRRRLAEEGTSFRALVDEVRQALAEELLATGSVGVEEVAHRLGYAEAASFSHAFTRWKGVPPGTWARLLR
ncbi:MAG: AraC family transcriptional regulator [Frankiales bacterium]|nr:AraC family transcriptional regulator [Frankiales bacterium]